MKKSYHKREKDIFLSGITANMEHNSKSLAHGHSRQEDSVPVSVLPVWNGSKLSPESVQLADKRNFRPTSHM